MSSNTTGLSSTGSSRSVASSPGVQNPASARPRATAFDAARSGSWHYYNPVANVGTRAAERPDPSTRSGLSIPASQSSTVASAVRPVFDAANPSTWSRTTRVLNETSLPSTMQRTAPESRGGMSRPVHDRHPQSFQDWNAYLTSAETTRAERTEILSDVLRVLHRGAYTNSEAPSQRRTAVRSDAALASLGPARSALSVLDDPDFGDTSEYWNALYGLPTGRSNTDSPPRRNPRLAGPLRTVLPRQPTHLNYEGIVPQVSTVRRRPSTASVASHASDGTLPEYSASAFDEHLVLPGYRSRASCEIEV